MLLTSRICLQAPNALLGQVQFCMPAANCVATACAVKSLTGVFTVPQPIPTLSLYWLTFNCMQEKTSAAGVPSAQFSKLATAIGYPLTMHLRRYATADFAASQQTVYELKAVVCHHGAGQAGGHYVVLQKQPSGMWMQRSDHSPPREVPSLVAQGHLRDVVGLQYERVASR